LLHIVQAFSIFNDQKEAIEYCINRFDTDTKTAFLDLYNKMGQKEEEPKVVAPQFVDDAPF